MKHYFTVLKMLVKNMFKHNTNERKGVKIFLRVTLVVIYLMFLAGIIGGVATIAPAVKEAALEAEVVTVILAIATLAIIFFGIPMILTSLYLSKDTEFFLSLPVSPTAVYLAKLSVVYISMLSIEVALLVPAFITLGVGMGMSAAFYLGGLVAVLLTPFLPILLASVIAMPLMYVVSAFKNRAALSSVVMIIMFMLFFAGYSFFVFQMSMGSVEGSDEMIDYVQVLLAASPALKQLANVLLPMSSIARVMSLQAVWGMNVGVSVLVNVLIYLGVTALAAGLGMLVSKLAYKKGAAAMLESGHSADGKKRDYRSSGSEVKALIKKEWIQLIRTPQFALNCFLSVFMPVVLIVFLFITSGNAIGMDAEAEVDSEFFNTIMGGLAIMIAMMMGVGLNMGALTAITREGEGFAFSKSLPSTAATQIKSKKILYLGFSYASMALSLIGILIFVRDWYLIPAMLYSIPYNYIFVTLAIYLDLKSPNLKWTTPQEAMKRNAKGMVPFMLNTLLSMIVTGITIMLRMMIEISATDPEIGAGVLGIMIGANIAAWCIIIGVAIALAVFFHKKLDRKAESLYDAIEI